MAFLVKLGVSLGLLALLVSTVDTAALWSVVARSSVWVLVGVVLSLVVLSLPQAWRWQMVLRGQGHRLSFLRMWSMIMAGHFFNQTLPSSIGGDAIRMFEGSRAGLPSRSAVNSVLVDRFCGLVGLIAVATAGQPFLYRLIDDPVARLYMALVVAGGLATAVLLVAAGLRLPGRLKWRPIRHLAAFFEDLGALVRQPQRWLPVLVISILVQLSLPVLVYALASSAGIVVSFGACLAVVPSVILLTVVPISVGGWGVREGAMVVGLGFVGVAASDALAISLLFGASAIAAGIPGAAFWLVLRRSASRSQTAAQPSILR